MKKLIALVLCMVMVAGGAAGAEEILFRDIPWLSTREYTEASLKSSLGDVAQIWIDGVNDGTTVCDAVCGRKTGYDLGQGYIFEGDLGEISSVMLPNSDGEMLTVGGYNPASIGLYYAYAPDDDGALVKDTEHEYLYAANYVFYPENSYGVYMNLIEKLNSVYSTYNAKSDAASDFFGESKMHISYPDGFLKEDFSLWVDDVTNSILVLHYEDYSESSGSLFRDNIQITYAYLDGDRMLKEAMETEQKAVAGDSTDGL